MVRPVQSPTLSPPPRAPAAAQRSDLVRRRFRLEQAAGRKLDGQDPGVQQQAAAQLLTELFFQPLLAEMRAFPFGSELTSGGFAEDAFGQQLDQRMADTVAASSGLTKQVLRYLDKHPAAAAAEEQSA